MVLKRAIGPSKRRRQGKSRSAAMKKLQRELHAFAIAVVEVMLWELQQRRIDLGGPKHTARRGPERGPKRK